MAKFSTRQPRKRGSHCGFEARRKMPALSQRDKWLRHARRRLFAEMLEPRLLLTTVTSVEPPANSHTAPVSTDLTATFDQNINGGTVTPQTFVVHSMQTGKLGSSAASVSVTGATVTLNPTSDFFPGELVQASITSGIRSAAGEAAAPRVWQLRTAAPAGSGVFSNNGERLGDHYSSALSLGDLDGDGDLDAFVVAFSQADRVWVNNGSGQFSDSGQALGEDRGSQNVALGDLDGDGDLDAYVAVVEKGNRVWVNNGTGLFSDSGQTLGNFDGSNVSLGDLDGDGDLDAFLANGNEPNRVWVNNGSGQFSDSGQALGEDRGSQNVALGDLDGDGDLDAFVANSRGDRVWLNNGSGLFSDTGQALGDIGSLDISLGDLDGDGDLDAFGAKGSLGHRVWLNNGNASFTDSGQDSGNTRAQSVSLGDLDADGDLDAFVVDDHFVQSNRVWLNDGGVFSNSGQNFGNYLDNVVSLGDLDGDGDLDAFVGTWGDQGNHVWLNQNLTAPVLVVTLSVDNITIPEAAGMATFTATLSAVSTQALTVDMGYTGTATIGTDYTASATQIVIPAGSLSGTATIAAVQDTLDEPGETVVVDITGVTNGTETGTQQVTVIITDDDEPPVPVPTVTSVTPVANSHDAPVSTDVVVTFDQTVNASTATPQTFTVHSMQRGQLVGSAATVSTAGDTVTLAPTSSFFPGETVQATVTSAIQSATGQAADPRVWQLRTAAPLGSGVFRASVHSIGDDSGYVSNLALGDLDGDGDLDAFVVTSGDDKANRVWLNNGGVFTVNELRLGDHNSLGISLGDLDGDGDLDAFVTNRDQGNRVWINTGGPYSGSLFSDSGQSLGDHFSVHSAMGDVDGDGDLDAFVTNYNEANRVWLNDGTGGFTDSGQSLGNHASLGISLGDLDGDGDLDAFVVNEYQGNRLWLNIGGSFSDSGQVLGDHDSYGVSLGDLDGDGDLDAFVTTNSEGNRLWLNSAGVFSDSGQRLGDHDSHGVALGDLDSDGDLDAFVANNNQGDQLWLNDGGLFSDSGQSLGSRFSLGVALGDVDGDGDLDSVVANYYQDRVWLNQNPTFSVSPTQLPRAERDSGTTAFNFTVTREFDTRGTTTVDFAFVASGNDPAEPADFSPAVLPSGTLTFADGMSSLPVTIEVGGDSTVENDEGFALTLSNPMGRNSVIGVDTAEAVIRNDDNVDLGDLPAPFPTLLASDGPAHVATGPTLGSARDTEADGQPSASADSDDTGAGVNDEDGVTFESRTFAGQLAANVNVHVSANSLLDAWIDFDGDHSFNSAGEQIFTSRTVLEGSNRLTFSVPADSRQGSTFARFRLSTSGGLAPTGGASDGEVEDHTLTIRGPIGSGLFSDSGQVLEPQDSVDVALGDFDGDGDLDAFVANRKQSNTVWLNNGGVFTDSGQLLGNHDSIDTALGDVDGDGDIDAIVANLLQGNRVWLNNDGQFTDSGQSLGDGFSLGISLGDLDSDGDLDAFVANASQPNRVWLNDGGLFSDSGQQLGHHSSNEVELGDLDGDGDLDAFVVAGEQGNRVWLNEGGKFTDSGQSLGDHRSLAMSLGDVDGDGDLDAFVTNYEQANRVWLNNGGQFTESGQRLGSHRSREVALGDLDGDGDLDAYVTNVEDGNRVWLNDRSVFTDSGQGLGDHTGVGVALGDLDGDGDLDAFVADYYQNRIWLNQNATLRVTSLVTTATGFVAEFNQDLDTVALNLYDTQTAGLGPADVTLEGASSGAVAGSLIVDASTRKVTFIKTGGPLEADTYTVTMRSAVDGFKTVTGDLLDGDGNGIATDDFGRSIAVAAPPVNAITVGISDIVRGPGQEVNLPADSTTGIPISISEGAGVRAIDLRISYDPALIEITSATVAAGVPAGASVIANTNTLGLLILVFFSSASLPVGSSTFVNLQAKVPATGPSDDYRSQQVLDVHGVTISDGNDNEFPVIIDDALHLVTYFGDVSGNGRINASDAAQIARFAALIDTGFSASLLVDPILVGDISGNRRINAADASRVAQFAALIDVPEIPPIPAAVVVASAGGPDVQAVGARADSIDRFAARPSSTDDVSGHRLGHQHFGDSSEDQSAAPSSRGRDRIIRPSAVDAAMRNWKDLGIDRNDNDERLIDLDDAIDKLLSVSVNEELLDVRV